MILYQKGNKTSSYYNTNEAGIINAGPYTGLTVDEAKDLNERQHADYRTNLNKAEAEKGARIVREGTDQFAKDYLHPAIKLAGAFNPIAGPMIGLTDAYQSYKAGNTGAAVAGAGLEALPYGGKYIAKGVGKAISTVKNNAPAIKEHVIGINTGLTELFRKTSLPKRPISEIFPITKGQKELALQKQIEAHTKGVDFVKKYNYSDGNFNLRPEIRERIEGLAPGQSRGGNTVTINKYNPVLSSENILISSRRRHASDNALNPEIAASVQESRGTFAGKHISGGRPLTPQTNITMQNLGLYNIHPARIQNTAAHELAHSMQEFGSTTVPTDGWVGKISKYDQAYGYPSANTDTPIGKKFAEAMIDPEVGGGIWEASPRELHSELMVERMRDYYAMLKNGVSEEDAMQRVVEMGDGMLRNAATTPRLNRFFKPGTSYETKRDLLKMLPAGGLGILYKNKNDDTNTQ